ncbi:MAG: ShlB/FhaC/HecB family hemolysin secretion/activation protein [Pseudomonadota bacterium]|nr:ShlB/FhaC/HecB family hemolysin secretion/activation protein [Pseudomonadota bacterium]
MAPALSLGKVAALLFLCLYYGPEAWAQGLPGAADPGRVEQPVMRPEFREELEKTAPTLKPEEKKPFTAPPVETAPEGFALASIALEGNTVFTDQVLTQLVADWFGKQVDIQGLQAIASTLEKYYQTRGYILTRVIIPPQDIKNGQVTLQVIEGYVAQVQFDSYTSILELNDGLGLLQDLKRNIEAMRPLHGPTLESLLLRMEDLGAIQVKGTLVSLPPDQAVPGAVNLRLETSREKSVSGEVTVDNAGSRFSGPWQGTGRLSFVGLMNSFDQLRLTYLTTVPADEVKYGRIQYSLPISSAGTTVQAYGSISDSTSGYTLEDFDITGLTRTLGLDITHPLVRSRSTLVNLGAGFEYRNIDTDILGTSLYRDRIRTARLTGSVYHTDSWGGFNAGLLEIRQGLDILGARETGSPELSRAEGHSDFTSLVLNAWRQQRLGDAWQASLRVAGQYAFSPLLSSEEFGFGGIDLGRGYDPSEITGDRGIAGSLELRYLGLSSPTGFSFEPFAFYDLGKVWNLDNNQNPVSAASAGLGIDIVHSRGFSGYLLAAVPLTRRANDPPGYANGTSARYLVGIKASF